MRGGVLRARVAAGQGDDGAAAAARTASCDQVFVGTLVSITSIGSGSLTLPMLLLVLSTAQLRRLVGTDVAFAVVLLVPAIIGHWQLGDVNVRLAGLLLAGSIPGVLVGTPLATRLPERAFRIGLSLILVIVGIRLFF